MTDATPVPSDLLQHAAFVRRLARTLLRDTHAAEDALQETWRASLEHPPSSGDARGWLARVVRNFARRRLRSEGRRALHEERGARAEALPPAEAGLERTETLQRVVDAVRALEEPYRSTILARFYEDLPPRTIAQRDGVSVETVNTRLKRGLARLRERLERREPGWRESLGLLAGESPCLPPHAGEGVTLALKTIQAVLLPALAVIGVVVLWNAVGEDEPRVTRVQAGKESAAPTRTSASLAAGATREDAPREPIVRPTVSGRALDEAGEPVPEARVHVLGNEDPFGDDHPAPRIGWNAYRGRTFGCDEEGRWRAELPEAMEVFVAVEVTEALDRAPECGDQRWVEAPAENVDFVLRRMAVGTLVVRVFEGDSRRPLENFRVCARGNPVELPDGGTTYDGPYTIQPDHGGVLRIELRLSEGGRRIHVVLMEPDVRGPLARLGVTEEALPEQEVFLLPGATEEVVFVLPERGVVRGIVVDELGAHVPDALVFFGEEARARGDEPFKPLRFERIRDGARTDAGGWFELAGEGPCVTVVHAEFSGATVATARAGRIELSRRGAIRGRLLDGDGRPLADASVYLDGPWDGIERARGEVCGADGRFAFEGVEAGAHALWRDAGGEEGELLQCVRLATGEDLEVELRLGRATPIELELVGLSPEDLEGFQGVAIGRAQGFSLGMVERDRIEWPVLPGPYWLVTSSGWVAAFEVLEGAPRASVALGQAELQVSSARRTSVQLVPADADPFLRLMAARVRVRIDTGAPARFHALPGAYLLVGEAGAVLRELELPAEGLALTLD